MNLSEEELTGIKIKIESFSFISTSKIKDNELIPEELVNLLDKYVWNQIDPNYSIRSNFINKALNQYYLLKIQKLIEEIEFTHIKDIDDFIIFWDKFLFTIDLFSESVFLFHTYIKNILEYSDEFVLINDKHFNNLRKKITNTFSNCSISMVNKNVIEEVINTSLIVKLFNQKKQNK